MFQKRTSQLAAILMLFSVTAQPLTSFAGEASAPAAITVSEPTPIAQGNKASAFKDLSFTDMRLETKAALSETQQWVKHQTAELDYKAPLQTVGLKIDRFQDSVKPAGRSMKASLKKNFLGLGFIQFGDRSMSVFGIMLMMAFGLVIVLLSMARPASRLGGRH